MACSGTLIGCRTFLTAGTYSVFIERIAGAGDYQVTAPIFGGPPPVCGNGRLDFNEQCDDGALVDGDCCAPTCQFEPRRSRCGTFGFCDGAGQCMTCVGDCGDDGHVTVDELLTMVNIALGTTSIAECGSGDANHDNQITITEILLGVNDALNGCSGD